VGPIVSDLRSVAAVLGAACGLGSVSVLAKLAYEAGSSPASLLAVRVVVAAVLLTALASPVLVGPEGSVHARDLALGVLGGLAFAGAGLLEFEALARLAAATVVLLVFVAPVWVALASWMLWGRALGWARAGLLVLVLGGIALLVGTPAEQAVEARAVGYALLASVLSAVFFMTMEPLAGRVGGSRAGCLTAVGAAAGASLLEPSALAQELGSPATAPYALAIGVLTAVSLWLLCAGLRGTNALSSSAIVGIEPLVAALLSWLLLGEVLGPAQLAGAASMLAGVTGMSVLSLRAPPAPGATGRIRRPRRGSHPPRRPARTARPRRSAGRSRGRRG
jgi:drug/metabolite transporter (DMT)-like permease